MSLQIGSRVLDRYVVESILGRGGMGEVYRARHERLGMPVALKVLTLLGDPELHARFEREAELMARVRHPNVVSIIDFGVVEENLPCIAMEFVEGESLAARLGRTGALRWQEAVEILIGILAGLSAIHAAGILHRDLKPANVALLPGPPLLPKLLDFGIAKPTDSGATRHTQTGMIIGTPDYMPPEQLYGYPLDARSDIYSAALMLWELLTGALPFKNDTKASALRRLQEGVPPPVAPASLPAIDPSLQEVLRTALAPDPNSRPSTAVEFARLLANVRSGSPLTGGSAERVHASSAVTQQLAPSQVTRWVAAARVPPSWLQRPEERRWLASLVSRGRSFTLGSGFWFAIQTSDSVESAGQAAGRLAHALRGKLGGTVGFVWQTLGEGFTLSGSSLTGASPLPPELQNLIDRLEGGEGLPEPVPG